MLVSSMFNLVLILWINKPMCTLLRVCVISCIKIIYYVFHTISLIDYITGTMSFAVFGDDPVYPCAIRAGGIHCMCSEGYCVEFPLMFGSVFSA